MGAPIARRLMAAALALAMVGALTATLAGCGKKNDPDPPPGEKSSFPRTYPKPQ